MSTSQRVAIVILAAGGSTRLGRPKQLVAIRGQPLIRHIVQVALESPADDVIVVLGGHAPECVEAFDEDGVHIVVNPFWEYGLSGSIRLGIERAEVSGATAVLLLLADQPFLDGVVLGNYFTRISGTPDQIIAANHGSTFGPPMFFGAHWFAQLKELKGDQGARQIVSERRDQIELIDWPEGSFDLDTPEDLARLWSWHNQGN
jgi:molybdenum cofactor cytidylyltransferase